jgi:hypothetical protein
VPDVGAVATVVVADPAAWAAAAAAAAVAAAVGWNVATNGACTVGGKITGTLSTAREAEGVPSCTVMAPVARMTWTAPGWRTPAQSVDPDETEEAATQIGPEAVTVTR